MMRAKRRLKLPKKYKGEPSSNLAFEALAAKREKDFEGKYAERATWFEKYEPLSSYGPKFCTREYEWEHREELALQRFTVEYLKRQHLWHPRPNTTWRDYAVEATGSTAHEALRHLENMICDKDQHALATLADIATEATRTISDLSRRVAKRVRPVARRRFFWPFLKAPKECFGDKHETTVKEIQLGGGLPFSRDALARIRETNIAVRTAMAYLCRLEDYREPLSYFGSHPTTDWQRLAVKLKPFSAKTWTKWFEVAWPALLAEHKEHPERDPELRKIGLYRADHSFEMGAQERVTQRTREDNIQDGIKEKVKSAVKRLARAGKSKK